MLTVAAAFAVGCVATPPPDDAVLDRAIGEIEHHKQAITRSPQQVARRVTIRVRNRACGELRTGSGVVVDDGLILTNRHVVEGAKDVQINTSDGRSIDVAVNEVAAGSDLGLLRVDAELPQPADLASEPLEVGAEVVVAGYPRGEQLEILDAHLVDRATGILNETGEVLVVDAPVQPGNSGGPLITADGELGGVVFAADLEQGSALVIPIDRYEALRDSAEFADAPPCSTPPVGSAFDFGSLTLPSAPNTTTPVPCPASTPSVTIDSVTASPSGTDAWTLSVSGSIRNPSAQVALVREVRVDLAAGASVPSLSTVGDVTVEPGATVPWTVTGSVGSVAEPEPTGAAIRWRWADPGLSLRCL